MCYVGTACNRLTLSSTCQVSFPILRGLLETDLHSKGKIVICWLSSFLERVKAPFTNKSKDFVIPQLVLDGSPNFWYATSLLHLSGVVLKYCWNFSLGMLLEICQMHTWPMLSWSMPISNVNIFDLTYHRINEKLGGTNFVPVGSGLQGIQEATYKDATMVVGGC